jgi:hypothetical protein
MKPRFSNGRPSMGPSSSSGVVWRRRQSVHDCYQRPPSAACHVDETEYLTDLDLHNTPLDGHITEVGEYPHLRTTDTCSADDNLFSEFLCPVPCMHFHRGSSAVAAATLLLIPLLTKPCPHLVQSYYRGLRIATPFELVNSLPRALHQPAFDFDLTHLRSARRESKLFCG